MSQVHSISWDAGGFKFITFLNSGNFAFEHFFELDNIDWLLLQRFVDDLSLF